MRKLVFQHQTQIEQVLHIYPWDKSGEYNCRNSYDVRRFILFYLFKNAITKFKQFQLVKLFLKSSENFKAKRR